MVLLVSHYAPETALTGVIHLLTYGTEILVFCALFATWVAPVFASAILRPGAPDRGPPAYPPCSGRVLTPGRIGYGPGRPLPPPDQNVRAEPCRLEAHGTEQTLNPDGGHRIGHEINLDENAPQFGRGQPEGHPVQKVLSAIPHVCVNNVGNSAQAAAERFSPAHVGIVCCASPPQCGAF